MPKQFRLMILAVFMIVVTAVGMELGLAWMYVFAVTHPGCPKPQYIPGIVTPEEHWLKMEDGKILLLYTIAHLFWREVEASPWESGPLDDVASISPHPLFLIYGEHELISGRGEQQYQAARQPKELWVVPGGAHGTNYWVAKDEYERRVLEFFAKALRE